MAKTKTPTADKNPAPSAEEVLRDTAQEGTGATPQADDVTEQATLPAEADAPVPADPAPEPEPTPAIPADFTPPEHYEQTFDLDEYAGFRRLNAAQKGLLEYVAKSYPRTIREWDAIKKANLGG